MAAPLSRRAVLSGIAAGAIGAAPWGAASASNGVAAQPVADGLTMFTGAGGNVVAHEGPDSILLIDGGSPARSAALLDAVAERFGGKPVTALVNTHWHLDQTGSNDALGARGVPIVAHENTRRWMTAHIEQTWNAPVIAPRADVALPTRTFYVQDEIQHGGESISLIWTPRAHTDGDIHAVFAAANVIAAGGVAYPSTVWPVLDTATGGWIGEMLDATRTLLARADDGAIIIPADGPPVTRADLAEQEEMLATLLGRFQQFSREGKGAGDMLQDGIAAEYAAQRGDPEAFIRTAWEGLGEHMRGLNAF